MTQMTTYGPKVELEDPRMQAIAEHVASTMKLCVLKAVAHTYDARSYPMPTAATANTEQSALRYFKTRTTEKQKVVATNVRRMIDRNPSILANAFGMSDRVKLTSPTPIREQMATQASERGLALRQDEAMSLRFADNKVRRSEAAPTASSPARASRPSMADVLSLGRRTGVPRRPGFRLPDDPIALKYLLLGGSSSFLGNPTEGGLCPDGKGRYQHYTGGSIYWSPETGASEVHGVIRAKWESMGWETSRLGYPLTDEGKTPDGVGRFNHFQGGSIYWSPSTGAAVVEGAIRAKWSNLGWEQSFLGYPTTDELPTPDTIGRFNHFQNGSIYWTPETGPCAVHKTIRGEWEKRGWELGSLGYPIQDTILGADALSTRFQGGQISWTKSGGLKTESPFTKLSYRVHKVRCEDETNPEPLGDDEILMSGVFTSVNNAAAGSVTPFMVGDSFDDGEEVAYAPAKTLYTFPMLESPGWPKHYIASILLCEEDMGGFPEFVRDMLNAIREEVGKLVTSKMTELIGTAIGGALGSLAGPLGSVIGAAVGWILGELFEWLVDVWEDDPFPVHSCTMSIPSVWHRWDGFTNSADSMFWTRAHGGEYRVYFDWALLP